MSMYLCMQLMYYRVISAPPTEYYILRWLAIFFLLGARAHNSVFISSSHDSYYDYYYNILLLYTYMRMYSWVRYYNWRPNESVRVLASRRWVRFVTYRSVSKTFARSMLQLLLVLVYIYFVHSTDSSTYFVRISDRKIV